MANVPGKVKLGCATGRNGNTDKETKVTSPSATLVILPQSNDL